MTITMLWNPAQQGELPKVGDKIRTSLGLMPVVKVEALGNGARHMVTCEDTRCPSGRLD